MSWKQFHLERTNEKEKMRSTLALSRMRLTSHIPCHAQRTHLWAARHGCKRTCALHRQIERANHTEKKEGHTQHVHVSRCPQSNVPKQLFSRSRLRQVGGVFVEAHCVKDKAQAGAKTPVRHPTTAITGDSHETHSNVHHTLGASVLCQERTHQNNCCAPTFW